MQNQRQKSKIPLLFRVRGFALLILRREHNHKRALVPSRENTEIERRVRVFDNLAIKHVPVAVVSGENGTAPRLVLRNFAHAKPVRFDLGEDGSDNIGEPIRARFLAQKFCPVRQKTIAEEDGPACVTFRSREA